MRLGAIGADGPRACRRTHRLVSRDMPISTRTFSTRLLPNALRLALCVAMLCAAFSHAQAETWTEGRVIEPLSLADQHGRAHGIDTSVHAVLFSRDMDGGAVLKQALGDDGDTLLARSAAVYVADMSGMPSMIRSLFAMPALRRRGYLVLVDRDGNVTTELPSEKAKGTLVVLDALHIRSIQHFDRAEDLRGALDALGSEAMPGTAPAGAEVHH